MSEEGTQVHPTAIVDQPATIGHGTKIWHFCHVMAGAVLGDRCVLGQNVFVAGTVRIGAGCRIQNNVSLYDGVVLEEDVFVGPSAVFTNVRLPRAAFPRRDSFERTLVQVGATVGANATIIAGTTIGRSAFVAAGAVVIRSVPPHALVGGTPAVFIGWVCHCGARLRDGFLCTHCGRAYVLGTECGGLIEHSTEWSSP